MRPGILIMLAGLAEMFAVDAFASYLGWFWIGVALVVVGLIWDVRQSEREQREAVERMRLRDAARRRRDVA